MTVSLNKKNDGQCNSGNTTENITGMQERMRKIWSKTILALVITFATTLSMMAAREIVPPDASVTVQFQWKRKGGNSWTTSSTILKGAVTESMMVNQLAARHPNSQIRILSASSGSAVSHSVQYQMKKGQAPWTTATTILNNALTVSMAKNQLQARYPGATIRILSFVPRK